MNEEESARLDALAGHFGLSAAGVVRMLLKDKERELGLAPPPVVAPKKPAKVKK